MKMLQIELPGVGVEIAPLIDVTMKPDIGPHPGAAKISDAISASPAYLPKTFCRKFGHLLWRVDIAWQVFGQWLRCFQMTAKATVSIVDCSIIGVNIWFGGSSRVKYDQSIKKRSWVKIDPLVKHDSDGLGAQGPSGPSRGWLILCY